MITMAVAIITSMKILGLIFCFSIESIFNNIEFTGILVFSEIFAMLDLEFFLRFLSINLSLFDIIKTSRQMINKCLVKQKLNNIQKIQNKTLYYLEISGEFIYFR